MLRNRRRLALVAGVLTAATGWAVAPAAHAASSGGTSVTFSIGGGSLSIAVPTGASLGTLTQAGPTSSFIGTGALGTTTVSDTRGGVAVTDTVTATASTFTGLVSNNPGIPASDGSLVSGAVTFGGGMLAATGVSPTGTNLGGTGQQVMLGVTTGSGTATYNPTLTLTVPASSGIADSYTGTVTQSVS